MPVNKGIKELLQLFDCSKRH